MYPKISIIIPIYNVEKYLLQCLESVKNQTFQDFEVVLVDDGSPDESAKLAKKFIQTNELGEKFHLIHKKNGGLSSARNAGMECAKGAWIMFLDSDDWIENNALIELDKCLREHSSELVIGGFQAYNNITGETEKWTDYPTHYGKLPENLSKLHSFSYCTGKLYSAQVIRENNLQFDERIKYGEDSAWQFAYIRCIGSFSCTNTVIYNYRINRDGALTASLVTPRAKYHIYEYMERFYQSMDEMQYKEALKENSHLLTVTWEILTTKIVNEILDGNNKRAIQKIKSPFAQIVLKNHVPRTQKEELFKWMCQHSYFMLWLFCKVYYRHFAILRRSKLVQKLSRHKKS